MTTRIANINLGQAYDVYAGRAGKGQEGPLGNPVKVGAKCMVCYQVHRTAGETIPCFRVCFVAMLAMPWYKTLVESCRGRVLGCFCKDARGEGACHCDPIVEYLDGPTPPWWAEAVATAKTKGFYP